MHAAPYPASTQLKLGGLAEPLAMPCPTRTVAVIGVNKMNTFTVINLFNIAHHTVSEEIQNYLFRRNSPPNKCP
jgi:hypothetical protein